jgi:hypothetical protein
VSDVIHGACLCEDVAFELRPSFQYGPDRAMGICRCAQCQRWSGGWELPFVVASPDHFRVTRGQELLAYYRDAPSSLRTFCRRCGSSLYHDAGTTYYVSAGTLRDLTLAPAFYVGDADRASWDR